MAITWLFVDRPVASLEVYLVTSGEATSLLAPKLGKTFSSARQQDGRLKILVFGLNRTEFQGRFAEVADRVTEISGVVGADPDGNSTGAIVMQIPQAGTISVLLT